MTTTAPAADAAEIVRRLIEMAHVVTLSDGHAVLCVAIDDTLVNDLAAFGAEKEDLEDEHDRERDHADWEPDDFLGGTGDLRAKEAYGQTIPNFIDQHEIVPELRKPRRGRILCRHASR